jgi:CheY-like chemotaxis protein
MHVLLIDPQVDDRTTLRLLAEFYGHQVDEAADGRRGLALATARRPDVIVMDLLLPGIDGFTIATQVASARKDAVPYVVAYTALDLLGARARSAGCDRFIVKPDMEGLLDLLQGGPPTGTPVATC